MKKRQTANFTLLEVILSLSILISIGSLLVTKGYALLQERQFYASIQKLSDEIYLTKVLSTTYQMDIDLILEQEGSGITLTRKTDYVPTENLHPFFHKEEKCKSLYSKEKKSTIHFYGNGFMEIEGELSFSLPKTKGEYRIIDPSKPRSVLRKIGFENL